MYVVCLDMEGVVVPEIWIAFAEATGIPDFKRTTRDEPDYDKLMKYRIDLLKQHGLGLKEVQEVISTIEPLEGAKEFLDTLRKETRRQRVPRHASERDPGRHPVGHLHPVRRSADRETWVSVSLLQRARRRGGR